MGNQAKTAITAAAQKSKTQARRPDRRPAKQRPGRPA